MIQSTLRLLASKGSFSFFRFLGCILDAEQLVCLVIEDEVEAVGYALATLNAKQFHTRMKTDFISSMRTKYPLQESPFSLSTAQQVKLFISIFHSLKKKRKMWIETCKCIALYLDLFVFSLHFINISTGNDQMVSHL